MDILKPGLLQLALLRPLPVPVPHPPPLLHPPRTHPLPLPVLLHQRLRANIY